MNVVSRKLKNNYQKTIGFAEDLKETSKQNNLYREKD